MREFLADYGIYDPVLPSIAGTYAGKGLVICGDAASLWEDVHSFCGPSLEKEGFDFMAVNMAGAKFPAKLEHWFSNGGEVLDRFVAVRREEYPWPVTHLHAIDGLPSGKGKFLWPWTTRGTSGLGALICGLWLDYAPIVLCGIPLDNQPHNGEPPWHRTNFVNEVRNDQKHWLKAAYHFRHRVRSMSGQTRDWFGDPSGSLHSSESSRRGRDDRSTYEGLAVR